MFEKRTEQSPVQLGALGHEAQGGFGGAAAALRVAR
jgi:hypothetical protein